MALETVVTENNGFISTKRKYSLLKMGSRSDNLCVNVATKYTSYICIHGAAVAN